MWSNGQDSGSFDWTQIMPGIPITVGRNGTLYTFNADNGNITSISACPSNGSNLGNGAQGALNGYPTNGAQSGLNGYPTNGAQSGLNGNPNNGFNQGYQNNNGGYYMPLNSSSRSNRSQKSKRCNCGH
jgi:hypothetical protein